MSLMSDDSALLVSFSAEQKDAIRHVVKASLETPRSALRMLKTAESSKRKMGKDRGKAPPTPGQVLGGCCFGEALEIIRHKEMVELTPGCYAVIPRVLAHMVNFLENHRHVEGIFRISGTNRRLKLLRNTVCLRPIAEDSSHPVSPHDVACLLKHFFRDIPGLLLSKDCLHDMMAMADRLDGDDDRLAEVLLDLCLLLPEPSLTTLRYVATFFNRIAANSEQNKMPIENLACVLTPNLMGPAGPGIVLTRQTKIVSLLLTHASGIGLVSKERLATAQNLLSERATGTRQAKSVKRWRLSEGNIQDRRPLGTINNFVSSLASKISSSSRRASSTPHAARQRNRTRSGSCRASPTSNSLLADAHCCRNARSATVLAVDNTGNEAAVTPMSESTMVPVSRGKRRATAPQDELSPPPKKHAETPVRRRVQESRRVTRSRAATLARTSLSAPVVSMLQQPAFLNTFGTTSASAPDASIGANMGDGFPEAGGIFFNKSSNGLGKPLDRLSVTRVACRRGTMSKRTLLDGDTGDSSSCGSYSSTSDCLSDDGESHCESSDLGGVEKSSSLASSVLHTTGLIIGRNLKFNMPLDSLNASCALDVSDISIHLPSISADGCNDDTLPLPPPVSSDANQSSV